MSLTRKALDALYSLSAGLAALSLLLIFVIMMTQVVMRELEMQFPGADDLSSYLCVATTFFALARTFKNGELIRVGIFLERVPVGLRRGVEVVILLLASAIMAAITWFTLQDVLFSIEIEEVAQGTVPFLTWIPKSAMPLGAGILLVAIIDELVCVLAGESPAYVQAAADRAARGDFSAEV